VTKGSDKKVVATGKVKKNWHSNSTSRFLFSY
jgi:hypothetical protein